MIGKAIVHRHNSAGGKEIHIDPDCAESAIGRVILACPLPRALGFPMQLVVVPPA